MRKTLLRYSLHSDFIIYLIRILIGFSIGYFLYIKFPQYSATWALISIVLVISPDDKEATKIAIDRTKSNLIGSASGIIFYFTNLPQMWSMLLGIIASVAICKLLNILSVARTAMVALIIVVIHEQQLKSYIGALDRFACVTIGCVIGLLVTLCTSYLIKRLREQYALEIPKE
ncbi:FUSC family protein [Sphingobacterium sp. SRCM116780]|uniref:FUSC family protein n=1 Tax=Sphingobacterium sp. SRCM116780 TaxID=2907623 RepID=UPI001F3A5D6C|nr:FUSC family protein [Sphingobacterium sp. SRCM116780]UIR54506.1 FUSC family protein [Sphingobacterium sp. SRCM116780]